MPEDKDEKLCIIIITVLSVINLFSRNISKFIITRNHTYGNLDLMYPELQITSTSINFIYLGLMLFTIFYFLIYKKQK